jgi:predicted Zn-dependent peptidase
MYHDLVYSRQLAQDITVMILPMEIAATLLIVATARPTTDLNQLIEAIDEHLDALAHRPPSNDHLSRARNKTLTSYHDENQKIGNRADLISQGLTYYDDPAHLFGDPARYARITNSDLQNFVAERLNRERRVLVSVGPRNSSR